jgi:hypothetical protein
MNKQSVPDSPSIRHHKRQMAWQIILPFVLMAVVIIVAAVLVTFGETSPTSLWRDVSLIWILAPVLALALLMIVVLGFIIYGLARVKQAAPRFTSRAQELTMQGANGIRKIADGAAKPVIWLEQVGAAVRSFFRR